MMQKPDVDQIDGLSPAISIEQKTTSKNPRSTVGTVTEIYDYMRLLWARVGVPYSPATGLPIESQTVQQMVDRILAIPEKTRLYLLAPVVRDRKGEYRKEIAEFQKKGFQRLKIDGEYYAIDDVPVLDKKFKHDIDVVVDRLVVRPDIAARLADSLETALEMADGIAIIEFADAPAPAAPVVAEVAGLEAGSEGGRRATRGASSGPTPNPSPQGGGEQVAPTRIVFSQKFACPESGFTIPEIEPRLFSFNSPTGACPACAGIGHEMRVDPNLIVPNPDISLKRGAIAPWAKSTSPYYGQTLDGLARHYGFSTTAKWSALPETVRDVILYGSKGQPIRMAYNDGMRAYEVNKPFEGVVTNLERRYKETESDWARDEISRFMAETPCKTCGGKRLKPEALAVKVDGRDISEATALSIQEAVGWSRALPERLTPKQNEIAARILKEIRERLTFLQDVGLDYLTLARASGTLSGGESQRIRLASQIGSGLTGVLYVLDEPSIGLHQRDNERLLGTLKRLRDLGNTVIVVEHDEDAIQNADYVVDVGPGAGIHGGQIVSQGLPAEVINDPNRSPAATSRAS
jgi:excinuclease ABC subunit A